MRGRHVAAGTVAGIAVVALGIAPASARVADRGTYVDHFTDQFSACNTTVAVDSTVTGRFMDQLRGTDPVPFYVEHFVDVTTYTNLQTGRSYYTVQRITHLDTAFVQLQGNLVSVSGKDSGTFSVYDSSGALYYRQAGLQRGTFVIDTMGTDDPSDDQVVDVQVTNYGHFQDTDFCADLAALTGSVG